MLPEKAFEIEITTHSRFIHIFKENFEELKPSILLIIVSCCFVLFLLRLQVEVHSAFYFNFSQSSYQPSNLFGCLRFVK